MSFIPGQELARAFYKEVVGPALRGVTHSAALIGWGSDVLGYDTERSTDHGWGPRVKVFVDDVDVGDAEARVSAALPEEFRGWPVRFGWDAVPVRHHVDVSPLGRWLFERLGFDPAGGVTTEDWLATPQQRLLEVTSGAVFHDDTGALSAVRRDLAWYPDDVWLWLLGCQWQRLSQEEAFVGRAAEVGDDLGSAVVASRLVRDVMRLCFLIERRYAPYSKWFGSAFAALDAAPELGPVLQAALAAPSYTDRERALVQAYEALARRHNALGVTDALDPATDLYYDRPFQVLRAERFAAACLARVEDADLRALPPIGAVDQFVDSTDVLSHATRFGALRVAYRA